MKPKSTLNVFLAVAGGYLITLSTAPAVDGTWNVDANGLWSLDTNWLSNIIADGSTFSANFTNNITADRTVSLDSDRTLTNLVFGDSDTATAGSWILNNNGTSTNNLILAGTTPTITVNALGTGKTATISAIIEGTAGLTKAGTGTLILSGVNTYSGTTIVNSGELRWGVSNALGSSDLTVNSGGTVNMQGFNDTVGTITLNRGTINISYSAGPPATTSLKTGTGGFITTGGTVNSWPGIGLGGNFVYNTDSGNETTATIASVDFNGGNRTFTIADGVQAIDVNITTSLYSQTAGNFNFIKAGAGTMQISSGGANVNYNLGSGTTSIQDGVLLLNKNTAATASGGAVGGTGLVTVGDGSGSAGSAVLRYTSTGVNDQIGSNAITINSDGLFDIADKTDTVGTVTLAGGSITSTTGVLSSTATYDVRSGSVSGRLGGSVALTKTTSGTVTLSGNNTYTGTTTVSVGVVNIQHANALGTTAGSTSVTSGAALEIQGGITVGAESLTLNGTGISSGGALRNISGTNNYGGLVTLGSATRINSDAGTLNLTNTGTITGSGLGLTVGGAGNISISSIIGTGTGTLTKDGTGTLTLSGANTYTSATNVNNGTLIINGSTSASSVVTVGASGTLGGIGTVGGATTVNGTLSVGQSPGIMTFANTLTLAGTTIMEIDGNSGAGVTGGHDFANLTGVGAAGVLTYGGTMTLDIGVLFGTGFYTWNLFDMASETGTFTSITLADQYSGSLLDADLDGVWDLTSGNNIWQFSESTGVLGLTVIPEPGVALLGALGMLLILRRRR